MLAIENKQINSIFERIVKDKNGVLILVRFTIIDGIGQIISATPFASPKPICLPCIKTTKMVVSDYIPSFISKISPYFSLDFLMSQPTRAPANR